MKHFSCYSSISCLVMLGLVIIPICSEDWTKEQILPSLTRLSSDDRCMLIQYCATMNSKFQKCAAKCTSSEAFTSLSLSLSPSYLLLHSFALHVQIVEEKKRRGEKNFWRYTLASPRPRNDLDQLNQHRRTRRDKRKVCAHACVSSIHSLIRINDDHFSVED